MKKPPELRSGGGIKRSLFFHNMDTTDMVADGSLNIL